MNTEIEVTAEKSIELADRINSIKMILFLIDVEYAKQVSKQMMDQGNWQDSAAVLNPSYDPLRSDIIRKQARMLNHLTQFIELGKEVDEMKAQEIRNKQNMDKISRMFM